MGDDFPTNGLLSGCQTQGPKGCPICGPHVDSQYSQILGKIVYQRHCGYLPHNHPYQRNALQFHGKVERHPRRLLVTPIDTFRNVMFS